jgi:catechol 2,3-dioxygenase-like lactoylglutathione lyase family enzyme
MQVEQVDFVSVPTRDLARAVAFYCDVLGLPVSQYTEGEVETPNVTLGFWQPQKQGEPFIPNENGIALRVGDVHAAVDEVRAAGAEVIGVDDTGVCHMGFVKDPDGNVLILHRRYAPKAPLQGADNQDVRALPVRPSETTGRADRTRRRRREARRGQG